MDPQQSNLNLLLKFLMDQKQSAIDPSNYPGVPTDALTSAFTKFDPVKGADVLNTGYSIPSMKEAVMGGKITGDAASQLYQLLTPYIRGLRGLETPSLLDAFKNAMR